MNQLKNAKTTFLNNNIFEIEGHEGAEFTADDILKMDEIARSRYKGFYGQLINRKNKYSHTQDSMLAIANLRYACAYALIVYDETSKTIAEMQIQVQELFGNKMQVFSDREKAIKWLENEVRTKNS